MRIFTRVRDHRVNGKYMTDSGERSAEAVQRHRGLVKRLLRVGVGAMVLGILAGIVFNGIADALMIGSTVPGQVFRNALTLTITILRDVLTPLGAAIVGSAVVIGALAADSRRAAADD